MDSMEQSKLLLHGSFRQNRGSETQERGRGRSRKGMTVEHHPSAPACASHPSLMAPGLRASHLLVRLTGPSHFLSMQWGWSLPFSHALGHHLDKRSLLTWFLLLPHSANSLACVPVKFHTHSRYF